jgi:hypothetical protein
MIVHMMKILNMAYRYAIKDGTACIPLCSSNNASVNDKQTSNIWILVVPNGNHDRTTAEHLREDICQRVHA